jgi:hypothetical protein
MYVSILGVLVEEMATTANAMSKICLCVVVSLSMSLLAFID